MSEQQFVINEEAEMERLATYCLAQWRAPALVFLQGPLGAGKTTFARYLLRALGHQGPVPSPSYTLIEPYLDVSPQVYHIDLYRISSVEELLELGLRDCLGALAFTLVEWPERAAQALGTADYSVEISIASGSRLVKLRCGDGE